MRIDARNGPRPTLARAIVFCSEDLQKGELSDVSGEGQGRGHSHCGGACMIGTLIPAMHRWRALPDCRG